MLDQRWEVLAFDDKTQQNTGVFGSSDRPVNKGIGALWFSMAEKIFVNKYIPEYVPLDLKWYERDGLMTYINQLNYEQFSEDPGGYLKKAELVNFDVIHNQHRGTPTQNFCTSDVKKMPQKERKKAVGACLRSERKDLHVEKKVTFSHFLDCKLWGFWPGLWWF